MLNAEHWRSHSSKSGSPDGRLHVSDSATRVEAWEDHGDELLRERSAAARQAP
jgi:hypothetical protein